MRDERPKARSRELLVQAVGDELLVYDTERHRAHALNHSVAEIWKRCDGVAAPADIARSLDRALQLPVSEDFVRYGLDELDRFHLLEVPPAATSGTRTGPSRRDLIRAGGLAALALPLIESIVAPLPAEAQSGGSGSSGSTGPTGA
jgi:hypothetical protein